MRYQFDKKNIVKEFISIFIITLFCCNYNFSQHFVKEGRSWNVASFSGFSSLITTQRFLIKNPIKILDEQYYHVYFTGSKDSINWKIFGYVREDSTAKVFFTPIVDNYGYELYDFNAKVGDTLTYSGGSNPCQALVTNIDTVTLLDGSERKRISVQTLSSSIFIANDYWIDGIGSITNPLFEPIFLFCYTDYSYYLLCAYEDGKIVYPLIANKECYINTGTNEPERTLFKIFPNPTTSSISIQTEIEGLIKFEIFDSSGKFISQGNLSGTEKSINVNFLKTGIYFILFQTNHHSNSLVQFVKK